MRFEPTLLVGILVLVAGCRADDNSWRSFDEGPNRLVVVFRSDVEEHQVNAFLQEHTEAPVPNKVGGHILRAEISGLMRLEIDGHTAFSIGLWSNTTGDEISAFRDELEASALVDAVYLNPRDSETRLK